MMFHIMVTRLILVFFFIKFVYVIFRLRNGCSIEIKNYAKNKKHENLKKKN